MSTDENSNNLNTKYNKLISDYKNLREKHIVLKNALINERQKYKDLESSYVECGIQSRKVFQELESLKFRNDMLTKQLNTLRDELDHEKNSKISKKGLLKSKEYNPKQEDVDVIKEELISKIEDCSKLHLQLSHLKLEYEMDTNNFRSAINDLENQLKLVKSQTSAADVNVRKALANEIEERSALEIKLENKDSLIHRLETNEKMLLNEVHDLQRKLLNQSTSPSSSIICPKDLPNEPDNYSIRSKEIKKTDSLNGSMASIPNNDNLNTNEIYMCSLIDKIAQLEQRIVSAELENQIVTKRYQIEMKYRDLYESYITKNGGELPALESNKATRNETVTLMETSNDKFISDFYELKYVSLNKQIYQAISKTALFFDEAKAMSNRLDIEKSENQMLREEVDSLKDKLLSCQDDLDLTCRQYENKLKEMSIHIAEMNLQQEGRKLSSVRNQLNGGDGVSTGNENISSIKGFINSLKK